MSIKSLLVGILVLALVAFVINRICCRGPAEEVLTSKEIVQQAEKAWFGYDTKPGETTPRDAAKKTGITGGLKKRTVAEFDRPVVEVEVVEDTLGRIFVRGKTEGGDTTVLDSLVWVRPTVETEEVRRPRGNFYGWDLGFRAGIGWDFDPRPEPCLVLQTFGLRIGKDRDLGETTISLLDVVVTPKYAGIGGAVKVPRRLFLGLIRHAYFGGGYVTGYQGGESGWALTLTARL